MSLVTEALRKARQEAAEREGRQRGIPRGLAVAPKRWGTGHPLAVAALIVAAAVTGAAATWWLLARRTPSATASLAPTPLTAPLPAPTAVPQGLTDQPGATAETADKPSAVAAGPTSMPPDRSRAAVAAPAPQTQTLAALPVPTGGPQPAVASGQTAHEDAGAQAGLRPQPNASGPRERTFVVDADLGSAKLHLDYVVYRPGSPFAGINGQQVVIGTVIEGFQVEEIGPESVRLRNGRVTVVLRTH
jgi:hypothetical protein